MIRHRHGKTDGSGRVNWIAGQTGCELSWVELTHIFQTNFFFFLSKCNLSIVYEFLNCN